MHARQAPPVRPSRSLEGLEKVVPPTIPYKSTRSELCLNKPLPAKPLPEAPLNTCCLWSDDSTVDSFGSRGESRDSSESYPIFVQPGSDDLIEIVEEQPSQPLIGRSSPPVETSHDNESSYELKTFVSEERYGKQINWAQSQNRIGTSHYFREKIHDFFPELATPSANSQANHLHPSGSKTRRRDVLRGNSNRSQNRGHAGLGVVRESIRSYVHRTLSKTSAEKSTHHARPTTAPSSYPFQYTSSPQYSPPLETLFSNTATRTLSGESSSQPAHTDTGYDPMRTISVSTGSTLGETPENLSAIPMHRQKQLAVPLSPYQKYGAAIWDTPKSSKRISYKHGGYNVRLQNYQNRTVPGNQPEYDRSYVNPTPPLTPPQRSQFHQNPRDYVKALQDGTSTVMVAALDGAKKKIAETKADRRRAQLKSQIKLIGPVNPYTQGGLDPWI